MSLKHPMSFIEPGPRQSLKFASLLSTYRAIPWSFKRVKCPGGLINLHRHYAFSFQTYDCIQVYLLRRLKESLKVIFWRNPSKWSWNPASAGILGNPGWRSSGSLHGLGMWCGAEAARVAFSFWNHPHSRRPSVYTTLQVYQFEKY